MAPLAYPMDAFMIHALTVGPSGAGVSTMGGMGVRLRAPGSLGAEGGPSTLSAGAGTGVSGCAGTGVSCAGTGGSCTGAGVSLAGPGPSWANTMLAGVSHKTAAAIDILTFTDFSPPAGLRLELYGVQPVIAKNRPSRARTQAAHANVYAVVANILIFDREEKLKARICG